MLRSFITKLLLLLASVVPAYAQVCDGYTDDTVAIQAKLNLGGHVTLPDGICRVSELYIPVDGTVFDGRGRTTIQRIPGTYRSLISLPIPWEQRTPTSLVKNVTITGLLVDGNRTGIQPPGLPNYFGIFVIQAENVLIDNNIVQDEQYVNVSIANGLFPNKNVTVANNKIYRTRWAGVHLGSVSRALVYNNFIDDTPTQQWGPSAGNGIDVEVEGNGSVVEDFVIEKNTISRMHVPTAPTAGTGIALQPAYGPIRRGLIQNNNIRNHQVGVWLDIGASPVTGGVEAVDSITINHNTISNDNNWTEGYGIASLGASNVRVTRNTVNTIFGPGGVPYSLLIHGGQNFVVAGNKFLARLRPDHLFHVRVQDSLAGPTRNVVLRDNLYNRTSFADVSPNAVNVTQVNNTRF